MNAMLSDLSCLPRYNMVETSNLVISCLGFPLSSSEVPINMSRSCLDSLSVEDALPPIGGVVPPDQSGMSVSYRQNYLNSSEGIEKECSLFLNKEIVDFNHTSLGINTQLVNYLLENATRTEDGRLVMLLFWNDKVKYLLAKNYGHVKNILHSNLKKLSKNKFNLNLLNDNILELQSIGIIERIPNLNQYLEENPTCIFLLHMPIFKPHKETTKCRMVFLSNLSEKNESHPTISHNQAMYSGPCINQKLSVALIL